MQTYNDVTDINLPLKAALHRAITERSLSHHLLRVTENRENIKNQHIDTVLFLRPTLQHTGAMPLLLCASRPIYFMVLYSTDHQHSLFFSFTHIS